MHPIASMLISCNLLAWIAYATAVIEIPPNIDAQKCMLYNNSATMPNQQFNVNFKNAFTAIPIFVYGINDYKLGDQFAYQNFQSSNSALTVTKFSISVNSVSSTNVKTFSLSYFAAQPQTSFLSNFQNVTNVLHI